MAAGPKNVNKRLERLSLQAGETALPLHVCGPGSSSLDAAWEFLDRGELPLWGSVLMESQSGGRGRMGRVWQSPPGHVYGALRLPPAPPFDGPGASLALAFLLASALAIFGWNLKIKWPNDLIFGGGKVGGLLLESKPRGLVAGLGLNLIQPPPGDWTREREPGSPPPAALPFDGGPIKLWSLLVKELVLLYNKKFPGATLADLLPEVEKRLCWRGQTVVVDRPSSEPPAPETGLSGRIEGLDSDGQLLLNNVSGRFRLWSGTVRLL